MKIIQEIKVGDEISFMAKGRVVSCEKDTFEVKLDCQAFPMNVNDNIWIHENFLQIPVEEGAVYRDPNGCYVQKVSGGWKYFLHDYVLDHLNFDSLIKVLDPEPAHYG